MNTTRCPYYSLCRDRLCSVCRWRESTKLYRDLQSLDISPAHFVHIVLPACPVPLQQLCQAHLSNLKKAVKKIMRQAWFDKVVVGGVYVIELDIGENLWVRPHVHMILETSKPANSRPIKFIEGNTAWRQLTGQSIEIKSLNKYTPQEVDYRLRYVAMKLRGESESDLLKDLAKYLMTQKAELERCQDIRQEELHRDRVQELEKYIQTAERLQAYIVTTFNSVLQGRQRRAFFGNWRGKKADKKGNCSQRYQEHCCRHCGSVERPDIITMAQAHLKTKSTKVA